MIAKTLDCRFIKSECIRGNTGGNSGYKQILRKNPQYFVKKKSCKFYFSIILMTVKFAKFTSDLLAR